MKNASRRNFIHGSVSLGMTALTRGSNESSVSIDSRASTQPGVAADHFFPVFRPLRIDVGELQINGMIGGSGPPLLLLHGSPQTHITWRKVAPELAKKYTVVVTDLRGYGDSSKPPASPTHDLYSKRAMAGDQLTVMKKLGFERFCVVGHDRGGRVAHRMVLDHPEAVSKLAVLDIVPTYKIFTTVTREVATRYYYQFLLAAPSPVPETLIGSNAEFWLSTRMRDVMPAFVDEEAFAEYKRCFANPSGIEANCEDYRASWTIDAEHDKADLDRKIECPLLVLWGNAGRLEPMYDVMECWKERATDVRGHVMAATHWLPEQVPAELCAELIKFLG